MGKIAFISELLDGRLRGLAFPGFDADLLGSVELKGRENLRLKGKVVMEEVRSQRVGASGIIFVDDPREKPARSLLRIVDQEVELRRAILLRPLSEDRDGNPGSGTQADSWTSGLLQGLLVIRAQASAAAIVASLFWPSVRRDVHLSGLGGSAEAGVGQLGLQ